MENLIGKRLIVRSASFEIKVSVETMIYSTFLLFFGIGFYNKLYYNQVYQ